MTTGRINQVAFLHPLVPRGRTAHSWNRFECRTSPRDSRMPPLFQQICSPTKTVFGQAGPLSLSFPLPHPRLNINPAVQALDMSGNLYLQRDTPINSKTSKPSPGCSTSTGKTSARETRQVTFPLKIRYAWHTHAPTTSPCSVPNPTDILVTALSGPRLDR